MESFKPLSFFIQRAKVLALYRRTLRSVGRLRGTGMGAREVGDIREEVRREYRRHRELENNMDIRACMLNGERQAAFLESGAMGAAPRQGGAAANTANTQGGEVVEQDMWVSTSEFHDESDVLGRVGAGWPWGGGGGDGRST